MKGKKNPLTLSQNEFSTFKYDTVFNLNKALLERDEDILQYPPSQVELVSNPDWNAYSTSLSLCYPFTCQNILNESQNVSSKYLRFKVAKKYKMYTLKSSLSTREVHVLPCVDHRYKIFILDSQEFDQMENADLGAYAKLIFANVNHHGVSTFESVWLPEIKVQNDVHTIQDLLTFDQAQK